MSTSDLWVLIDLRGAILHSYHSGKEIESDDDAIKSPGHTLSNFVDRYLTPSVEITPLNRIICVNDAGSEYRKKLSESYKATRVEAEPRVKLAHEASRMAIRELLHSLGILQVSVAGTEADDVIAYLCGKLPGYKLVHTVDQDLIALADSKVTVVLKGEPKKDMKGVLPRHVALYKSIVGDSSDNIKGVPGMGSKAWQYLHDTYGLDGLDDLASIIENREIAKLKQIARENQCKVLTKLVEQAEAWVLCYNLASLHPELVEARYGYQFRRLRWEKRLPDRVRLQKLCDSTGSQYLMDDLGGYLPNQWLIQRSDWDDDTLNEAAALFDKSRFISIDWETSAPVHQPFLDASTDGNYVDMLSSTITGFGLTCGANLEYTFYFNFGHADVHNRIPKDNLLRLLKRVPEGMPVVAHHSLFEHTVLFNELGYSISNLYDTKLMSSHVNEAASSGLKDLSKHWLNYNQTRYSDVIESGKAMCDYPASHVFKYGADDPLVTGHLFDLFYAILCIEGTWDFVREYEFNAMYPFSDAYIAGVTVDYDEVARQHKEDQEIYDTNIARIREILSENSEPEGYKVWLEEVYMVYDAQTSQLRQQLHEQLKNKADLKKDAKLWPLIKDATPGTYEYQEALEDSRNQGRLLLEKKVKEACTYRPFVKTETPAKFSMSLACVNKIALHYGLDPITKEEWADVDKFVNRLDQVSNVFKARETSVWLHLKALKRGKPKDEMVKVRERAQKVYQNVVPPVVTNSGTELNLDSSDQMKVLFYGILGLPIRLRSLKESKTRDPLGIPRAPQTEESVVQMAVAMGDAVGWKKEVLDCLIKAKKASTRIKFFYNKLPMWRHPLDGNIHPQFNQVGTETRRPSGSAPNMLQLSKKGDGVKVRRCILPNKNLGHDVVVSIDWDGEELRVLAGLSGDQKLTACYVGDDKLDPHSITAAEILKVSYDGFVKIRKDEDNPLHKKYDDVRKDAKNVNFGSSYGIGAAKLARKLLCHPDVAKAYLDAKKTAYFGIEEWREKVIQFLHGNGYVETLFGTRKHIYDRLNANDDGLVSYYERAAVNFQIQGLCADYLKYVLTHLYRSRLLQKTGAVMIAAIYDELVFSCHHSVAAELIIGTHAIMTMGIPGMPIPMLANPSVGKNFGDQVEVLKDCYDPLTVEKVERALDIALGRVKEEEENAPN